MPIDANILLQRQPVQFSNPLAQAGQLAQIQGAQQQNQLAQLQFDQAQRGVDDTNRLNDVYKNSLNSDGTIDRTKLFSGISSAGLGSKLPDIQKKLADTDKAKADLGESLAKVQKSKIEQYRDALSNVRTPEQAAQWLQSQYNDPDIGGIMKSHGPYEEIASRIPTTPAEFAQWQQQSALGMTKFIELNKPTFQTRNTGGKTDTLQLPGLGGAPTVVSSITNTQSPDNAATVAVQKRGQDMADARAREQIAQGKVPSGYRQNPDGSLSPIPGGPAEKDKSLTETQGKATGFAARMQDANKVIDKFDGKVNPSAVAAVGGVAPDWLPGGGALNAAANYTVGKISPDAQLYQQAQENWLTANLRLESGAVIGDKEKENEAKKWFPQPGDTPARISQKAEARKVAEKSMLVQAGPGAKQVGGIVTSTPAAPAAGVPADIGDLLNKYGK